MMATDSSHIAWYFLSGNLRKERGKIPLHESQQPSATPYVPNEYTSSTTSPYQTDSQQLYLSSIDPKLHKHSNSPSLEALPCPAASKFPFRDVFEVPAQLPVGVSVCQFTLELFAPLRARSARTSSALENVEMWSPCLLLLPPLLCGGLAQEASNNWLKVQELLEVQEGLCAHVPCSFFHPNFYRGYETYAYWFREKADIFRDPPVATNNRWREVSRDTHGRFHLPGDPRAQNCSLSISDARRSDKGTYFFRVEQGNLKYNYIATQLSMRVTALTQKPAIHVPEPLVSGQTGRLICSLPGACKQTLLRFSWPGEMLDPHIADSPELSLTPGPRDHGRNLSCRVTLQRMGKTTERTIRLNVSYAPQNLTIHVSFRTASELRNQSVQLLCIADSNPPAEFTWCPGSPGNVTITQNASMLELHLAEAPKDSEFTCHARNYLGSQTASVRLSVLAPPQLLGPQCTWEARTLRCFCSTRGWPVPSLRWWLGPELLPRNYSNASIQFGSSVGESWTNISLSLQWGFDASHKLSCEASNMYGAQKSSVLLLLPEMPQAVSAADPMVLGVAGALALASLCVCLFTIACIVRVRRKSAAAKPEVMASEDPVMDSVPWGLRQRHRQDTPTDHVAAASEDSEELHYTNLSFHGLKPRESPHPAASGNTEYSEIRTRK